jgi:hypothetical protein
MERTLATSRTDRLRCEAGAMLIDALVAAAIMLGGGLATIAAYDSTTRASHTAEREAEAVAIAEKELERIVSKPYAQINDCTTPGAGTGRADDPNSWVQGTQFFVAADFRPKGSYATPPNVDITPANRLALESFSVANTSGCVVPQDDGSSVGISSDSKINHSKIFRFVTYQGQQCASNVGAAVVASLASSSLAGSAQTTLTTTAAADVGTLCTAMSTQQAKRVTVAVVLNQVGNNAGLKYPVYVSTLITDPDASLHAGTGTVLG